jgi:hypothetical protein
MVKNELNKDMNFEMSATLQFNILGMLNDTFFYYTNSHIRAPFFIKDDWEDLRVVALEINNNLKQA